MRLLAPFLVVPGVLLLLLVPGSSQLQSGGEKTPGAAQPQPGGEKPQPKGDKTDATKSVRVTVHYLDGSKVHMSLVQDKVEVETAFGKLTVPRQNIRAIEFGFHLEAGESKQINNLVLQLGDDQFKFREIASQQLTEFGARAYPALQAAAQSKDTEISTRAKKCMEVIEKKVPSRLLKRRPEDVVKTDKFTIVGKVTSPALVARTEYFGEVKLKPTHLFSVQWLEVFGEVAFVVDSASHGSAANQWLETDYHITPHERLTIVATGQVDLWPQGPGQYMSNPDGRPGTIFQPYVGAHGQNVALAGSLIGRIGENGAPFLIGARLSKTFDQEGKLYLHIVPSPWNNASLGSYRVTITTGDNPPGGE